ncbi:MAG: putative lipoprotein YmbA, partial [Candidatus Azotimanducaceae bacterium]
GTAINRSFATPDYVLRVSIEAFEQGADGRVQLAARYQVSNGAGELLATKQFSSAVNRDSGDRYGDMVADLQALYAELSREIAISLQQLEQQHAG